LAVRALIQRFFSLSAERSWLVFLRVIDGTHHAAALAAIDKENAFSLEACDFRVRLAGGFATGAVGFCHDLYSI